jgi:uncharacterized protein
MEVIYRSRAVEAVKKDAELMEWLKRGAPWRAVTAAIEEALKDILDDPNHKAYNLTAYVLDTVFGSRPDGWETYKSDRNITYVRVH